MRKIKCIVWELTLKCNAKCIHCGSNAGNIRDNELTINEIYNIIDQLAELNYLNVNLIGGEVFLHPHWQDIIKYLNNKQFKISIITNGSCLNENNLEFLNAAEIKNLGISLDGGKALTNDYIRGLPGCFNKIMNSIKIAQRLEIDITIITTLNKINIKELSLIKNILLEKDLRLWQIQTASFHGRLDNNLSLDNFEYYVSGLFFARERRKIEKETLAIVCNHDFGYYSNTIARHTLHNSWFGCPAGLTTLGIRSNGKVQGCLSLPYEKFIEGNLKTHTIKDLLNNPNFCQWNKKENRIHSMDGFCQNCVYKDSCLAGCSDIAYSKTGSIGNNPQCYHMIESEMENLVPENDFEWIFKELIPIRNLKSNI